MSKTMLDLRSRGDNVFDDKWRCIRVSLRVGRRSTPLQVGEYSLEIRPRVVVLTNQALSNRLTLLKRAEAVG